MAGELATIELGVSEFVAVLNQSLAYAFPDVVIIGELANLRVSKNRWVYFDLKDESALVKCFGTIYQLPGQLEDGMQLKVRGQPRLHNLYGFSVNIESIQLAGEGTIKRAAQLLQAKLTAEGLFDSSRKRAVPFPPRRIGLITSKQSAAYADFIKILNARWGGVDVSVIDVQVQGEVAPAQITAAIEQFNSHADGHECLILIRGGGSAEDLAAFSTEQVTRAVAASRIPTVVAIGHEVDLSLAELAADLRASTPSNAAELLVPEKKQMLKELVALKTQLQRDAIAQVASQLEDLKRQKTFSEQLLDSHLSRARQALTAQRELVTALNPGAILRRGYAIIRKEGDVVRSVTGLGAGGIVNVEIADGGFSAKITEVKGKNT